LQEPIKEYTTAALIAASLFPQNKKFFLPIANGLRAFSMRLLSILYLLCILDDAGPARWKMQDHGTGPYWASIFK